MAPMSTTPRDRELLSTRRMAEFVRDGMLGFDGVIDADLNAAAIDEMKERHRGESPGASPDTLTPLDACYPAPSALGAVLRHRVVAGAIHSLLGPDPVFDHDFTHHLPAGWPETQHLHMDAMQDSPSPSFDIQLFYYPHAVGPGEGGTRFVPGTHLRRVHAGEVGRYQHMLGEIAWEGPPGSVVVAHHGIWHAGQANPSDGARYMHKFRFNPTRSQVRHWDLSDFDELHNTRADHMFATMEGDNAAMLFRHRHPWQTISTSRIETVQRAKLWRYLSGDDGYDVDYYLTRIEQRDALT